MSVASVDASGDFRVGGVLRRAWRLLAGDLPFFLAVALLVYAASVATAGYAAGAFARAALVLARALPSLAAATVMAPMWTLAAGVRLAVLLPLGLNMIGQAVLLLGAVPRLRGQSRRVGETLRKGLARAFPLLGLVLLWSLALGLCLVAGALILLLAQWELVAGGLAPYAFILSVALVFPASLVPAATLAVMWTVAVPACAIESFGPVASMIRSAALTKGCRWRIFRILLLLALLSVGGTIIEYLAVPEGSRFGILVDAVLSVPFIAYCNAAVIVAYHHLRGAEEGGDAGHTAAIFD